MTMFTSSRGATRDVDIDIDAVCAYEEDHPDWSLVDLLNNMERMRFTDLNLLVSFLGFEDYKTFIEEGFSLEDLNAMLESSKYLGFTDSASIGD